MKNLIFAFTLAVAVMLAAQPARGDDDTAMQMAGMISGSFVGSTPNNTLRLSIQPIVIDPLHLWDLFLSVSGKFEDTSVRQQGLIRLEGQARSVYFGYVPQFDPTVTAVSPGAGRFNAQEASAACGFSLKAKGDGFAGDTLGSSCAMAMRGASHPWTVEIEPGTITLRDPKSGETLRFKKVEKAGKTEKAVDKAN